MLNVSAVPDQTEALKAQARSFAKNGRFRDALRLGAGALSDASFDRDMRDWRHAAFYEGARSSSRPDWPPNLADPRPDLIDQIPEIAARELSGSVLGGAIQTHGSLIVRGLFPKSRMPDFVQGIEDAFGARAAGSGSAYQPLEPIDGRNLALARGFVGEFTVLTIDAPSFLARWLEDIEAAGVVGAVTDYLGERPALAANKATLYRLPADPGTQWHQDGAFLGKGIRTVNLWVACTDCGEDAPGLDVIPWRLNEIVETGTQGSMFDWSVGDGFIQQLAGARGFATPRFAAGDAILFDQLCLHRTGVRPGMTRGRYAVETWMFAPSVYPDGPDGVPLII